MSASPAPANARLRLANLADLPGFVRRPPFDPARLQTGIVHLGVGAFHRAHQAVYTEDAIAAAGGAWGIVGVSLRRPDAGNALCPQDGLYSVEFRDAEPRHRVIGALREVITATQDPDAVIAALASADHHVVTLTVTEKGYGLASNGDLDVADPDIAHDLTSNAAPRTTLGWLTRGLAARYRSHRTPMTLMSCDNLSNNSHKLRHALLQFASQRDAETGRWIEDAIRFPSTMVDCITPASDAATFARAFDALGYEDAAAIQREAFSQWVIEDDFASARPAWENAGAEVVRDVAAAERVKLHVLNATHSALAYLGIPRGHTFVREAIADAGIVSALDELVRTEIAPALAPLQIEAYWQTTKRRFANPNIDHALAQIAEDGSKKLAARVFPLLIDNARAGRPLRRLADVVRAWLSFARGPVKDAQSARITQWSRSGGDLGAALDDDALFPDPFRTEPKVRAAILGAP